MKIYGTQELGARLHQWHSGMDAVYGVGSYFYAGMGVTQERLNDAIDILQGVYSRRKDTRMPAGDARHLSALIRDLKALRAGNYMDPEDLRDNPGCGCSSSRPRSNPRRRRPKPLSEMSRETREVAAMSQYNRNLPLGAKPFSRLSSTQRKLILLTGKSARPNPTRVPQRVQALLEMGKREGMTPAAAVKLHRRMTEIERQGGSHRDVDTVLDDVNDALQGHGIESIEGTWHDRYYQNIVALYVNMGDTYNGTILYDTTKNRFYATSWGDWVERNGERLGVE